jgi:head-tail adaptor
MATGVDIGAREHLITLENPGVPVPDGDGGYTEVPVELATVFASIQPATARDLERLVAGTVQSTVSHVVTLEYVFGVSTRTRIRFDDPMVGPRLFDVNGIQNPEERNLDLILVCSEAGR